MLFPEGNVDIYAREFLAVIDEKLNGLQWILSPSFWSGVTLFRDAERTDSLSN
jgi:hypothetical protein